MEINRRTLTQNMAVCGVSKSFRIFSIMVRILRIACEEICFAMIWQIDTLSLAEG
jgi:hypothetical protein